MTNGLDGPHKVICDQHTYPIDFPFGFSKPPGELLRTSPFRLTRLLCLLRLPLKIGCTLLLTSQPRFQIFHSRCRGFQYSQLIDQFFRRRPLR